MVKNDLVLKVEIVFEKVEIVFNENRLQASVFNGRQRAGAASGNGSAQACGIAGKALDARFRL